MPSSQATESAVKQGYLVVISGPSGTGKTSICNALLERLPRAVWSVSATTRPIRANEVDGQAYRFVSMAEFEKMRREGQFLECAEYVGNWYGTPLAPIQDAVTDGRPVILEIDVQGGIQIAERMPGSVRIFVLPPTPESLEARLKGRKTETETQLRRRLEKADGEIATARDSGKYRNFVVNDVLEETIREVIAIVKRETEQT